MCSCVLQSINLLVLHYFFVQTNTATKSIVLNCSEIVVNEVQFKGKDQCEFAFFVCCPFCVTRSYGHTWTMTWTESFVIIGYF